MPENVILLQFYVSFWNEKAENKHVTPLLDVVAGATECTSDNTHQHFFF